MVKVAVAGATSVTGGYIIPAIAETKKHDVVALSRKTSDQFAHLPRVQHIVVDYSNPAALDAALQGVHTVICTIFDFDEDAFLAISLALLQSAIRVGAKRFAPCEFSARGLPDDSIEVYRRKAVVADAVQKSGIEYTLYESGFYMNSLAIGTPGANGYSYGPSIDVQNCTARIPGDGSTAVVYIRGEDMGKFIAASLDLPGWPEVSRMVGDRKTFAEVLQIAEQVRGRKFNVTFVSVQELKDKLAASPPDPAANLIVQLQIELVTSGRWNNLDGNLQEVCPEVKPIGVEEFLRMWWGQSLNEGK